MHSLIIAKAEGTFKEDSEATQVGKVRGFATATVERWAATATKHT